MVGAPASPFVTTLRRTDFRLASNQQARDGNNQDRQFGGDEFEVNVFFLMDENYGEDETGSNAQESDDDSGNEHQRSRITVRKAFK